MSESEDCTHARSELEIAEGETEELTEAYEEAAAEVPPAEQALATAQEEVNLASNAVGVAERALGDAEQMLRDQESMPDYLGRDRDIEQKQEAIAAAQSDLERAVDRRDAAVRASDAAQATLNGLVAAANEADQLRRQAAERESNWRGQVLRACGGL